MANKIEDVVLDPKMMASIDNLFIKIISIKSPELRNFYSRYVDEGLYSLQREKLINTKNWEEPKYGK